MGMSDPPAWRLNSSKPSEIVPAGPLLVSRPHRLSCSCLHVYHSCEPQWLSRAMLCPFPAHSPAASLMSATAKGQQLGLGA